MKTLTNCHGQITLTSEKTPRDYFTKKEKGERERGEKKRGRVI